MNLVRNAIEAMTLTEGRERVLTTSLVTEGQEVVEVVVADTGIGFEPGMADKMFEAFFSEKPGGMGLGLSICRSIIETHGGRLWATTNHPQGSVFKFSVPTTSLSR
jgi:signal transduction histidine kinase